MTKYVVSSTGFTISHSQQGNVFLQGKIECTFVRLDICNIALHIVNYVTPHTLIFYVNMNLKSIRECALFSDIARPIIGGGGHVHITEKQTEVTDQKNKKGR